MDQKQRSLQPDDDGWRRWLFGAGVALGAIGMFILLHIVRLVIR